MMSTSVDGKGAGSWDAAKASSIYAVVLAVALVSLPPNSLALAVAFFNAAIRELQTPERWDGRIYFALAIVLTVLLLMLHPRSIVRRALYYAPLILLYRAYRAPLGDQTATTASTGSYQFGILLASWTMRILDRLYLNDPETAFRYKGEEDTSPVTYKPAQKLFWALELMAVTRGIGWNWQIRQIPAMPQLSRGGFLLWKAKSAVVTIIVLYAIRAASALLVQLFDGLDDRTGSLAAALLHPVCLHVFMYTSWAFVVFSSLNLAENFFALFFVGFRITERWSKVDMWPPVFGDVRTSYSIRRGWGVFWHQNMRHVCQSPGNFIVRNISFLREPESRLALLTRRYLRLMLIFVFSGLIHAGGSIYMTQRETKVHDGGNTIGFIYQGLALIGEDIVLWWLNIDDSKPTSLMRRLVGFGLVHGYASYATPTLKVIPLAIDHGLEVPGNLLMSGVKMVGMGANGVLKNPFATMVGSFNV
ncbi:membrane bound O-acyl transferase family domain-containing protein [Trichoderma velutinum]